MRCGRRNFLSENFQDVINQFHLKGEYGNGLYPAGEKSNLIDANKYLIHSEFDNNINFSAMARMNFTFLQDSVRWIPLYLFYKLEVDSIFWSNGKKASFFRAKENPVLWIENTLNYTSKDTAGLIVYYKGDLIDRNYLNWFYIKSTDAWYPWHDAGDRAIFQLEFINPERYLLVSIGDKVFDDKINKKQISRWRMNSPTQNASFNIGQFEEFKLENKKIPSTVILRSETGHLEMAHALAQADIPSGRKMMQEVGQDVENSLIFFSNMFGPPQMNQFRATEIPYSHGESFPGLIHLSWWTFQLPDGIGGFGQVFRAHEVAHQWWGIGVDYLTYHDQWLSEGLSEYSGLWYMQVVRKDNKNFFDTLKEYREEIVSNRKYLLGNGIPAGPIWLGARNETSETEGDFGTIVYTKGAWVIHMLRNMLLDLKTFNEDVFTGILKDYYEVFKGKAATTLDFQSIVEKHTGENMDWFFDQWVYGTDVPKYKFAWTTEATADGKFLIKCRVEQHNVNKDFQMPIPFRIEFDNNQVFRLRRMIKGSETFYLIKVPLKSQKVVFNDLESVLSEVDNESW